jgi:hypothetical protein
MERCGHGMEPTWCYICRIEASGVDPQVAWGLEDGDGPGVDDYETYTEPMSASRVRYLRFLCEEFGVTFDDTRNEGEAAVVTISFLEEPMTRSQARTLGWFADHGSGTSDASLTYGEARQKIRRLVALRGLRSA